VTSSDGAPTTAPDDAAPHRIDPQRVLRALDTDQRAAVTAPPGPVAVIAGAGSGKTRVLTSRIAYRIATGTAIPNHIVAFTFTRQAAIELQRRLSGYGVERAVVAGTFHSVAYRILRRRWEDRGRRDLPRLQTNRVEVLTELLEGNRQLAGTAVTEIEWARARLVSPTDYLAAASAAGRRTAVPLERIARVYADFETFKRRKRLLDFDDLLSECTSELRRNGVADAVAWWHRHLHVDEFQDINPLQFEFLETLRNGGTDIFVVGDPAQAIYGWNGADPTLLDRVQRGPLKPITVELPTNYRSTPQIVAAGDRVLAAHRMPAEHRAERADGDRVLVVACDNEDDEAKQIVRRAAVLRQPGAGWSSVAVLARTHELLRRINDEFARARIPTRVVTRRGAPDAALAALVRSARAAASSDDLHRWAVDLVWPAEESAGGEVDPDDARRLLEAVQEFEDTGGGNGASFAAWLDLNGVQQGAATDAVELVTVHAAKGREWPAVIVAGVDTGGFPAPQRTAARAEEARLLYVALTRATDRLVVTWAQRRGSKSTSRSPLLPDLGGPSSGEAPEPLPDEIVALVTRRTASEPADERTATLGRLRQWRSAAARAANVPESFVLEDRVLERIADTMPESEQALARIEGVGAIAARRLAARILPLLRTAGSSPAAH